MPHPALTYRQFSVQGATPLSLVVMLYDGAIAALQRAVKAIEARNIEEKCKHLKKAMAIITQLEGSLNLELGGEIAQTLKRFYTIARAQVMKANIENSKEILTTLTQQFSTVREAWDQIARPAPAPPPPPAEGQPRRDPSRAPAAPSLRLTA